VDGLAANYHNLGSYLHSHVRQPVPALASHLTAALIRALTGVDGTEDSIQEAAADLRVFGTAAVPPTDVADLCRQVGDIPGTDLASLIATLSPGPETAEAALRDLIAQAVAMAVQPPAQLG
jgi:hypothetical protein